MVKNGRAGDVQKLDLPVFNLNFWPWCDGILPRHATIEPLSGGLINHVFRLRSGTDSWVVKHAPPFVASAPEMMLSAARLQVEFAALNIAKQFNSEDVRVPAVLAFFPEPNFLIMEDVGDFPDLGVVSNPGVRLPALAEWLEAFHAQTRDLPTLPDFGVHQARKTSQYLPLAEKVQHARPELAEEFVWAADSFSGAPECLTMGDFWPASVLVQPDHLVIIDWEFSALGNSVQDVAHLCAHLFLSQGPELEALFLDAYSPSKFWSKIQYRAFEAHRNAEILQRTIGIFAGTGGAKNLNEMELQEIARTVIGR